MGCRRYGGIMIELARRRMMMGGSALPYDAEVEYLDSSGTQWIDTGVYGSNTLVVNMEINVLAYSSKDAEIIGSTTDRWGSDRRGYELVYATKSSRAFGWWHDNHKSINFNIYIGNKCSVNISNGVLSIKDYKGVNHDIDIAQSGSFTTSTTLPIFATRNPRRISSPLRIYSVQMKRNGVTILDFIPVRKNGVGYMYDKVSGQLFGNQGKGQFIIGPDKTA